MIVRIIMYSLSIILILFTEARATHVSVSAGIGHTGPITTISATLMEKGQWGADFQSELIKYDTFSERKMIDFADQDSEVHTADYLQTYFLGISYSVTENLMVHLRIPYVYRDDISESDPPDEVHRHGDAKGFGDLSVHLHQRLFKSTQGDLQVTLLAGLEFPTGKTSDRDDHGETFEAEFQPGSGSWDPSLGISITKHLGRFSIDSNILYTLVTEGTRDTDLGDILNYNIALSYRAMLSPVELDLIGELNGIWIGKEEVQGDKDPNSGGNIILFSPGIRISLVKGFMFYASYSTPVIQDLNGVQNDIDYRLLFGINFVM